MAALDFDAKVVADGVEIAAREIGQEFAREPHGADARALQQQPSGALDFSRDERPIEARVVGDEDAALQRCEQRLGDGFERRRVAHHPGVDPRESGDERRDRDAGVHERVEHDGSVEQGHGDLHNAVAAERADAGRFDVDDGPAAALEHRARSRGRRGDGPAAVARAAEPLVRREQRGGNAVGGVPVCLCDAQHVAHDREAAGGPALEE